MNMSQNPCAEIEIPARIRECYLPATQEEIDDVCRQLANIAANTNATMHTRYSYNDLNTMRLWGIMRRGIDSHSVASSYRLWNCNASFSSVNNKDYWAHVALELRGWSRDDKNWNVTPESYDFRFAREMLPKLTGIRPFPDNPIPFPHSNMLHVGVVPPSHKSYISYNGEEEIIFTSEHINGFDRRHLKRR